MRNFRLDDESGHQEALFSWAAYRTEIMPELQYMYHVPNGGKRDKATAAVLKRQGVKAGVPDIMLPAARAGYHGLTGRLTREPELRYGGQDNSTAITRFTLAVDDGKDTDFINIKCFGRIAEWVQKWLSKGSRAEVTGKIKTGSYESQRTGGKVYYTEVVANSVGFGESKAEAEARGQQLPESDGFMNIPEGADEELPFN